MKKQREPLLSVAEALTQMLKAVSPLHPEDLSLPLARGRVLFESMLAQRDHPAFDASAMDGYAVRSADIVSPGADLRLVGSLAAGYEQRDGNSDSPCIESGETMRIFTGARLPEGADMIVIQENAHRKDKQVVVVQSAESGRYVRRRGSDFAVGDCLLQRGHRLRSRDLALLAAMGYAHARVHRSPRIGFLALGSELAAIGDTTASNKLPSSNSIGMAAFVEKLGCEAVDLGITPDNIGEIVRVLENTQGCDLLVTMGGASVGDHDLTRKALEQAGFAIRFHGVAVRPGKPLLFAAKGATPAVGLPGNPVSTLVCADVFLRPVIDRLQGGIGSGLPRISARLTCALEANDERQEYMRAKLAWDSSEEAFLITPFSSQDSAHLSALSQADALAIRAPHAAPAAEGESVPALWLDA